ncbi:hypothetical protein ACFQVC_08545 [Streptomyces monticola]|uniref:Uncharacterized protein n=1 Tax=Streptomyces monticola TaxID=2666263 RepID=A0ABW2JDZ1_9ACTN
MSSGADDVRPTAAPGTGTVRQTTRRRRWLPSGKATAWAAAALAVLALVTYETKPLWQPWWYAATLCDGTLAAADLADVLPDERLQPGRNDVSLEAGSLKCSVHRDDRHFVLSVRAQTDPAEVRRELAMAFTIPHEPDFVFLAGVPGFQDDLGPVILQECPGLGRDEKGSKRRLLTRVIGPSTGETPDPALLRIAVSAANSASDGSGCGAKPLPLPEKTAHPEDRTLSLAAAAGTPCGWLTRTRLPENPSGKPWAVQARTTSGTPITSCALIDPAKDRTAVEFNGWYGDWTDEPFETLLAANVDYPDDLTARGPMMAEHLGRATARCGDESANFQAYSHMRENEVTDRYLTGAQLRPLLNAFTKDQAHRRGCDGVELPGRTIHPMSD